MRTNTAATQFHRLGPGRPPKRAGQAGPRRVAAALGARLRWHRRPIAVTFAAMSLLLALAALRPHGPAGACGAPAPTIPVLVAARDAPGGTVLTERDVRIAAMPRALAPAGALSPGAEIAGRRLAYPIRAGEPVTDVRLVGSGLLAGYVTGGVDVVATPVRVADAATVRLVRPGDLVDVLAASPGAGPAAPGPSPPAAGPGDVVGASGGSAPANVADDAPPGATARLVVARSRVLLIPRDEPADADRGHGGALVVLATSSGEAARLAHAAVSAQLSLVIRP